MFSTCVFTFDIETDLNVVTVLTTHNNPLLICAFVIILTRYVLILIYSLLHVIILNISNKFNTLFSILICNCVSKLIINVNLIHSF